jgi:hypothetical protein
MKTDTNRDHMLAYIEAMSSDADLLKLCSILRRSLVEDQVTRGVLDTFRSPNVDTKPEQPIDAHSSGSNFDKPERNDIFPGKPTITKIGTETKAALLHNLGFGTQPAAKFTEHLKLLWSRGEVKWDGEVWYV